MRRLPAADPFAYGFIITTTTGTEAPSTARDHDRADQGRVTGGVQPAGFLEQFEDGPPDVLGVGTAYRIPRGLGPPTRWQHRVGLFAGPRQRSD